MRITRIFSRRIRSVLLRSQAELELRREIEMHIEQLTRQYAAAGMSEAEARRAARREFGPVEAIKENCRDARRVNLFDDLRKDLGYALRLLRKSPGFTACAILLLAAGIGANTAVFTVASQVLLRGIGARDPGDLMQLKFDDLANRITGTEFSYPAFRIFSQPNPLIAGMFARSEQIQVNITSRGVSDLAHAVFETPDAAAVLGVAPALGRLLNRGDAKPSGESPALILSYQYWQKRFGGDTSVIGTTVTVDTLPFVIAGVMPREFHGIEIGVNPDVTLPAYTADTIRGIPTLGNRASWGFAILCRRKPRAAPEQIRASLEPAFSSALADFVTSVPASMAGNMRQFASKLRFRVDSASKGASSRARDELRRPLTILIVITALVFLVTSANLAGLMIARTEARAAEVGIRLAIGCSRGRLLRQLITESTLMALTGSGFGVLAALWTGPLISRLLSGNPAADALAVRPDASTLGYGLALGLAGGVLLGLSPALRAMRLDPQISIRRGVGASGFRASRFARTLIVCQVAVSMVLSLAAGQFIRSLENYEQVDPGFRPEHLVAVSVRPDLVRYGDARLIEYARRMYDRLSAVPGVKSVTFSTGAFGQLTWNTLVTVPGYTLKGTLDDTVGRNIAGPRFAETLGLTLIAGRDFDSRDTAGSPATVIVNESFARHFFRTENALGRQISFIDSPERRDTIVGIVRDARDRGVREAPKPVVYSNYEHDPLGWLTFTIRVNADPRAMLRDILSVFRQAEPEVPLEQAGTVAAQMDEALSRERVLAVLSSILGALATVISMVGLYGLIAYSVVRRTREIAIRLALGAKPGQVRGLAVWESIRLLLYGGFAGLPGYLAVSRLLRSQVYQVTPADPGVIYGALCLLVACAAVATYVPASRATRVNPAQALKYE